MLECFISPRTGPVDMLQQPKRLIFNGYRFQNTLIPPSEFNSYKPSYLCPSDRQRVGIFRDKAYIDKELI